MYFYFHHSQDGHVYYLYTDVSHELNEHSLIVTLPKSELRYERVITMHSLKTKPLCIGESKPPKMVNRIVEQQKSRLGA